MPIQQSQQLSNFLARLHDINNPLYIINAYHSRGGFRNDTTRCVEAQQNTGAAGLLLRVLTSKPLITPCPPPADTMASCHWLARRRCEALTHKKLLASQNRPVVLFLK